MINLRSFQRVSSVLLAFLTISATSALAFTHSVSATSVPTPSWVAPVVNGSFTVIAGSNGTSYSFGTVTTNTTFGTNNITIVGTNDVVLVKRIADGSVAWVVQIQESTNAVGAGAIAVDSNDNVYIRGNISAVTATFGSINVTSVANSGYLTKISTAGVVQWVRLMSSSTHLESQGVAVDSSTGNIYTSGRHRGLTAGTVTIGTTSTMDSYVVKYDSSGTALWGKSWGGDGTDSAIKIHVQNSSHIIVGGVIQSTSVAGATSVAFDAVATLTPAGTGRYDAFVAKMNTSDGSFVWATMATGTQDDETYGISTDSSGNVFATGYFASPSLTFGSTTLTNFGTNDVWIAKLNSSGQFQWARSGGGSDVDAGFGLVVDPLDNVYISGYFGAYGSTTKNAVFGTTTLTTAGASLGVGDGFIASYSSNGTFRWALSTETATGHGWVGSLGLSNDGTLFAASGSISGNIVVGSITTTYSGTSGSTIISFAGVGGAIPTTTTTLAPTNTTTTTTLTPTNTTTLAPSSTTTLAPTNTVESSQSVGNPNGSPATTSPVGLNSLRRSGQVPVPVSVPVSATTSTSTTVAPEAPVAPQVSLGAAGVVIGGKLSATTISRSGNSVLVAGGGIEANIYGEAADGKKINLDANGDLRLTNDDRIVVEADGFDSASVIKVWMYSTPTQLGRIEVSQSGSGMAKFSVPASVDAGEHRIVLDGANEQGQDVIVGLGIAVGALEGASINKILIIAPLTLAIMFAILLPSVMRRRREQ